MPLKQIPLELTSSPAQGRDDFFMSASNELALHWMEGWPQKWHPFPALIIHGPKGSGKTHLAEVWCKMAQARSLSPEQFMKVELDSCLGNRGNLILDRIDLLIGEREQEEKLFHLYNSALQNEFYLMVLSRISPAYMEFVIPDLASRLRAAPHAAIETPDDDLLTKVIAKRFHDQGYVVAPNVLTYIVARIERSWEAVDALVESAIRAATADKKQITIPLVRDLMIAMG